MKQCSSIWRRITHFKIQIDPTIVLPVHLTWFDIIIPEGSYHVEDINEDSNEFIQREIRKKCHYNKVNDKDNIEIYAKKTTH